MIKVVKVDTKVIVEAVVNNTYMPYFLNAENELVFKENMKELYVFLKEEHPSTLTWNGGDIYEKTWNETKIVGSLFTSIFSHWNKIINQSSIYFIEAVSDLPQPLELELEGSTFILFYKKTDGLISKRDECILEIDEDTIFDFFDWLESEIVEVGSIEQLANKYKAFLEVFVTDNSLPENNEDSDDDITIELSEDFYMNVDSLKKSILSALEEQMDGELGNLQLPTMDENGKFSKAKIQDTTLNFKWNGVDVSLHYPFNLTIDLTSLIFDLGILDNKNGWLAQQNHRIQETVVGLWADFVYNKHKDTKNLPTENEAKAMELDWDGFSEYLLHWLRFDYSTDPRKIEKKIHGTYDKIIGNAKVHPFNYIEDSSEFIKCVLYVEKMAAIQKNRGIIFDVESIQKQYFYSLQNEHVLTNVWGFIIQDRIKKTKVTKTFEYQFETLKSKFPNFHEVIDYYSGAMYIFEQTGTPPAPVLLLGSPGLGKTHFASEVAKIIGSMLTVIPVSSLSAGWIISGAASQWKDAQMGKLAQALVNGTSMSPVLVLDEIDKKTEGNYDPLGALYPLLEHQTAKEFVDEYLEFPLDSSSVIWVATANNLNSISEPILDRFVVFDIAKLSPTDTIKVANNIFNELTNGLSHQELSQDILDILKDKTPRQIKQVLKKALAYAAVKRTQEIVLQKEHLDLKTKIKKIGF